MRRIDASDESSVGTNCRPTFGHDLKLQTEFTDTSEPVLIISTSWLVFDALWLRVAFKFRIENHSVAGNFERKLYFRWWVTMGCQHGKDSFVEYCLIRCINDFFWVPVV